MRVWFDLTNTAHVFVLRPLAELLEARGHEVTLTARPLSHTLDALDDWGHPYTALGHHGGASRLGKARAAASRTVKLLRFARSRRFDCALAHGSTDLPITCRLRGIPSTAMLDYEWAVLQHRISCRFASRALAPDAIPLERLANLWARPPKLVRYPGLKEEYYLNDFEPNPSVLDELGIDRERLLCVVRTAPSYALYLGGSENALLPRLLRHLGKQDQLQTVVMARTPEQAQLISELRLENMIVPGRAVDGRSLIAYADLIVSAGGTMNREAAVLGTPAWTIFEGKMGAIDEMLIAQGRLHTLRDVDEIELKRKAPDAYRQRKRRDPAELLRLALPGSMISEGGARR
jgi:predicted glycosyltransferase